jgi:hypothetical protein
MPCSTTELLLLSLSQGAKQLLLLLLQVCCALAHILVGLRPHA